MIFKHFVFLATICDKLLTNFNNKFTCSVLLELSKAFDNHDISIEKKKYILYFRLRGKVVFIIKSYLSNRIQCTKIKMFHLI